MGKPRKEHPEEESIFANNPFVEGLFEWMDSPEGERHLEIYDVLAKLMDDVHLDARNRKVIWPDAEHLDIEQSVQRIQKRYRDFPRGEIEEFMIDWIDMGYEPENYSPTQFDELDSLTVIMITSRSMARSRWPMTSAPGSRTIRPNCPPPTTQAWTDPTSTWSPRATPSWSRWPMAARSSEPFRTGR